MYSEQEDMRNRQDQGVLQYPNCLPVGFWCECVHLGFFFVSVSVYGSKTVLEEAYKERSPSTQSGS